MIIVVNGDLLDFEKSVDVIVNAWNRNFIPYQMLITHGVSADWNLLMKFKKQVF